MSAPGRPREEIFDNMETKPKTHEETSSSGALADDGGVQDDENAEPPQSKFWAQDEVIKPADGPFDYSGGSPDLSGPGDPLGKSTVVHNLAGKGTIVAGGGDHSFTGSDKPFYRKIVPGSYDPPTGGTDAPSRGRSQHVENPTGITLAGSGHSLPPPAPETRARGRSAKVKLTTAGEGKSSDEPKTVGNALLVMTDEGGNPNLEGSQDDRNPIVMQTNEGAEDTTEDSHEKQRRN